MRFDRDSMTTPVAALLCVLGILAGIAGLVLLADHGIVWPLRTFVAAVVLGHLVVLGLYALGKW